MSRIKKFHETLAMYRKHGWRPARVLMVPATMQELHEAQTADTAAFDGVEVREWFVDAIWVTRPAQEDREAWELRQVGEPFALFELFEPDEIEEDREEVRREMEARLREHVAPES